MQTAVTEERATLTTDILKCLSNENMLDMCLIGSDGVKVRASRLILAARSNVLGKMLYGEFKEASRDEIKLDFTSNTLSSVVKFCYSDSLSHLPRTEDSARQLFQVLECAHYLEMPGLEVEVVNFGKTLMTENNHFACSVLDEGCLDTSIRNTSEQMLALTESAKYIVRRHTESSLLPANTSDGGGVLSLKPGALSAVMADTRIEGEEIVILRSLKKWADAVDSSDLDRNTVANICAAHIDLTKIRPSNLIGFASECGLISNDRILDALREHALQAEMNGYIRNKGRFEVDRTASVMVEGAGVAAVNGIYHEDGEHNGAEMYSLWGEWEGERAKFSVFRWDNDEWYISRVPEDEEIGESDNDFYASPVLDDSIHPPSTIFEDICDLGREPPPSVRFIRAADDQ